MSSDLWPTLLLSGKNMEIRVRRFIEILFHEPLEVMVIDN